MSHVNSGACPKCQELLNKYPDFNGELRTWFETLQASHPETHLSCAGRGKIDQEAFFSRGASRAHYGQSAHNYGCALDLFVNFHGLDLFDKAWFDRIIDPAIEPWLNWYGKPDAPFKELPHVEVRAWRKLVAESLARLVE